MNLLKQNQTFDFFPPLKLDLLLDTDHSQVNLMSCNMQLPSLEFVGKKKRDSKYNKPSNSVSLKGDLYFYTGLKEYYKVNVKREILAEYFVEKKKDMLFLDKQTQLRSSYISGDLLFPVKPFYEFGKRRFVLNLHTRDRLHRNEIFIESFVDIVNDLNSSILASLILTLHTSHNLPISRLRFYNTVPPINEHGRLFHFMGIQRLFLRSVKLNYKPYPLRGKRPNLHATTTQRFELMYLMKYLPNRHFYLLQYLITNLHNKTITTIFDMRDHKFLRTIIKEFMSIKLFLRFYMIKIKLGTRKKEWRGKSSSIFKSMLFLFNSARQIYKNIFEYVFHLCALQLVYLSKSKIVDHSRIITINAMRLAHIYSMNVSSYKLKMFSSGIAANGRMGLYFKSFTRGILKRNKRHKSPYLHRKRLRFYQKHIINTRYRSSLFHRRYELLMKHNPVYLLNELRNNTKHY